MALNLTLVKNIKLNISEEDLKYEDLPYDMCNNTILNYKERTRALGATMECLHTNSK